MSALIIFLIALAVLLVIGLPIFASLGLTSIVVWHVSSGSASLTMLVQKMFNGLDSFVLMCIPLFMLTGELMNGGGISKRLIDFAQVLVGWIKGGLGHVVIVTCVFLAAILGSPSACAAMVGAIMIPEMTARGYDKDYSAGLVAGAATVGPIIPPSTPMLVYAVIAGVSVSKLFLTGYVPGILIALLFMIWNGYSARKKGLPAEAKPTFREVVSAFLHAIIPLLLPVIIMGGILSGVFTPTESAAVAVLYCFIISMFVYRELKAKDLIPILVKAAKSTAMLMMVMAAASFLGYVLTLEKIPQTITALAVATTRSKAVYLIIVNIILVIAGMFLDAGAAINILTPVLLPAALAFEVDPVFFGVMITVNLALGVLTPPVGLNLYVVSSLTKMDIVKVTKAAIPYIVILAVILISMSIFPDFYMWFPSLFTLK